VYATYKAGVKSDGTLTAIQISIYNDSGCIIETSFGDMDMALLWMDNAYYCGAYSATTDVMHTTLPSTTAMRAPGVVQSVMVMETIMEHLATALSMPADALRAANFYKIGDKTPYGEQIKYFSLDTVWSTIKTSADFDGKQAAAAAFNKANRWRKRGVALSPIKYGLAIGGTQGGCQIHVYPDGSVQVNHGGIEMGQGINVKVAQTVSYALGCPLESIEVTGTNTDVVPIASCTGGSTTSELCCAAAKLVCDTLNTRLEPVRKANPKAPWAGIVGAAGGAGVNLSAETLYQPPPGPMSSTFDYFAYGAAISVVEVDVLTGETELISTDILYDCGVSLNPQVDVGQVEGAFIMGVGYYTTEHVQYDTSGVLTSRGTWDYKPPAMTDIPESINITLLPDAPNPAGFLRSKASGEPPYALAMSVHFAIRSAVESARADAGTSGWFSLAIPADPAEIVGTCLTTDAMLTLK